MQNHKLAFTLQIKTALSEIKTKLLDLGKVFKLIDFVFTFRHIWSNFLITNEKLVSGKELKSKKRIKMIFTT